MRHILATILLFVSTIMFATNTTQATDSLLSLLKTNHSPEERIKIYRNLADISLDKPEFKEYLLKMYHEASNINDKKSMLNALNDIIIEEINLEHKDSVQKYTGYFKKIASPEELEYMLPLYRLRLFESLCYSDKREEIINEVSGILNTPKDKTENIYTDIASVHFLGTSYYFDRQFEKALPYLEKAMKLAETLPAKQRFAYVRFISWRLSLTYGQLDQNKEAINRLEHLIRLMEQNYETEYKERPFYKIELYFLQYYSFIISNITYLTVQQEQYYWNKIQQIGKKLVNDFDKYNYYISVNYYYRYNNTKKDLPKAIAANDSLIKYAQTLAPQNLSGLYSSNSQLYEELNDFNNALQCLKISSQIKDSLSSEIAKKQLNELQVKYDLNALNNEKTKLQMRNKQNLLISLAILLIILVSICSYLYFSLKKEKRMKSELKVLHNKAQESEKMKQEFINSICHEIRTPLNSIVGFSDLILNEEIDAETRREFPAEIQKSTRQLTGLISSMLEVANLDVSEEKLPCEITELRDICVHAMEYLTRKADIKYRLEIMEDDLCIKTNAPYLTQIIEHLLNNANKFTEQGSIALGYQLNEAKDKVIIYVTDTGCGIPEEMHEEVFSRFFKLDTFVPGNGLGLYLCRLITKRLGGEIKIDSQYKNGTKVAVTLPVD